MIRHCNGTDPNLGRPGQPCACGLTFDDVERSTIAPHNLLGARIVADDQGSVWFWEQPTTGEVPDAPPVRVSHLAPGSSSTPADVAAGIAGEQRQLLELDQEAR